MHDCTCQHNHVIESLRMLLDRILFHTCKKASSAYKPCFGNNQSFHSKILKEPPQFQLR